MGLMEPFKNITSDNGPIIFCMTKSIVYRSFFKFKHCFLMFGTFSFSTVSKPSLFKHSVEKLSSFVQRSETFKECTFLFKSNLVKLFLPYGCYGSFRLSKLHGPFYMRSFVFHMWSLRELRIRINYFLIIFFLYKWKTIICLCTNYFLWSAVFIFCHIGLLVVTLRF